MSILDNRSRIQALDAGSMSALLERLPGQLEQAAAAGSLRLSDAYRSNRFDHILFLGVGGSAIGADVIRNLVSEQVPIPFWVSRHYRLPTFVNEKTLLIASSYSGNTEEVLSALQEGFARRSPIVVMSSGGILTDIARSKSLPLIALPKQMPPRLTLLYSVVCFLAFLETAGFKGVFSRDILNQTIKNLETACQTQWGLDVPESRNPAKKLAQFAFKKLSVIYAGADLLGPAAYRWRSQIEENGKSLAFHHLIPEMTHNEIVGWLEPKTLLKQMAVFMLLDRDDHPRIKIRADYVKALLKEKGVSVEEVISSGESRIERMFSLILLGDWASFYLAILNGVDPTSIQAIEHLKHQLAQKVFS